MNNIEWPWTTRHEGDNQFWESIANPELRFAVNKFWLVYLPASDHPYGEAYAVAAAKQADQQASSLPGPRMAPALLQAEDGTPYVYGHWLSRSHGARIAKAEIETLVNQYRDVLVANNLRKILEEYTTRKDLTP